MSDKTPGNENEWKESSKLLPTYCEPIKQPSDKSNKTLNQSKPRVDDDDMTEQAPNILLPTLMAKERNFLELIENGNVEYVKKFISVNSNFNINCENYQGITALHIAVKKGNEKMVDFLLSQPNIYIGDAHLMAISLNQVQIATNILDTLKTLGEDMEYNSVQDSAEFPANVSPLMLAAEKGHYEMVGLLLKRGHIVPKPHKPHCFCKEECLASLSTQDPLNAASGKLHIYKALSSPAYICQTSDDPILTAFKLSQELLEAGHIETIYRRDYEALSEGLRDFAVKLIECRTSEEVETILCESRGSKSMKTGSSFPRLLLAMDYKQKEFIAHPNVQQTLMCAWYGNWYKWRGYGSFRRTLIALPRLLIVPFLPLIFIFAPRSNLAKFFTLPINIMLNYIAAYFYFLVFVFLQSNIDKKGQVREVRPSGIEFILLIFIIGHIAGTTRMIILKGPRRFFRFLWNVHEVAMEGVFVLTFLFWISAYSYALSFPDENLERKYWHYLDPELIAEGLYLIFTVLAFLRLLLICELSSAVGPLQVSLGKMVIDCVRYTIIFSVLLLSFAAGLARYYSYYEGMKQKNPDTGDESSQEQSFVTFWDTLKTLFWGIFGMSSFENADVVIENLPDDMGSKTIINEHILTEFIGYMTFAIYMILTVVVLLNMLIATMSNTFQRVINNVDTEWMFGRTKVFLVYMDQTVLPPPFNILPTGYGVLSSKSSRIAQICPWCCPPEPLYHRLAEERKLNFELLMSQLVQRYYSSLD